MNEPIKERQVDFSNAERTRVSAKGYEGEIKYGEKGEYPGVSYTTWEFKDIDGSLKDGALIYLEPGDNSPYQLVESETAFSEVP